MKPKTSVLLIIVFLWTVRLSAQTYRNPVIPGFHPDPSVCRVGNDFYAVNSSFNYFPGVPIFHSRDLMHWEQIGNVLDRPSQLPLKGASSWLGIYAPTIRYHAGTYYMITTNVGNGGNFMVTASDPRGPWSEPIWLEQQGIDPSLYFENDKCYMVSNPEGTITLCEIDSKTGKQTAPSRPLWKGDGGRYPEGPHIYKKDGYYYLLISEGGTELAHHLTIARSRNIYGPYQSNPANPILTNCNAKGESMQIQGTGHGDFVQDGDGRWWVMFLAYRNFGGSYHHLGRETCLAPVEWKQNEWPTVYQGQAIDTVMTLDKDHLPVVGQHLDGPLTPINQSQRLDFAKIRSGKDLGPAFVYLQNPIETNYQWGGGQLRMTGHGTLTDNRQPTFLGVRQCAANVLLETSIDLTTLEGQTGKGLKAGLTVYQIHDGHMDFYTDGKTVGVDCRLKSLFAPCHYEQVDRAIPEGSQSLQLRLTSDGTMYHFLFAVDHAPFRELGAQNCSLLSTEVAGGFTGVSMGMYVDGIGSATFQSFDYIEH
ncbi:MAG: glycoside hydrolase family 43 protein [Prevotella sp.]|nr:glycoside hydrolase family 43 protein [Prevotella sp.]